MRELLEGRLTRESREREFHLILQYQSGTTFDGVVHGECHMHFSKNLI